MDPLNVVTVILFESQYVVSGAPSYVVWFSFGIVLQRSYYYDQFLNIQATTKITIQFCALTDTFNAYLALIAIKFDLSSVDTSVALRIDKNPFVTYRPCSVKVALAQFMKMYYNSNAVSSFRCDDTDDVAVFGRNKKNKNGKSSKSISNNNSKHDNSNDNTNRTSTKRRQMNVENNNSNKYHQPASIALNNDLIYSKICWNVINLSNTYQVEILKAQFPKKKTKMTSYLKTSSIKIIIITLQLFKYCEVIMVQWCNCCCNTYVVMMLVITMKSRRETNNYNSTVIESNASVGVGNRALFNSRKNIIRMNVNLSNTNSNSNNTKSNSNRQYQNYNNDINQLNWKNIVMFMKKVITSIGKWMIFLLVLIDEPDGTMNLSSGMSRIGERMQILVIRIKVILTE